MPKPEETAKLLRKLIKGPEKKPETTPAEKK